MGTLQEHWDTVYSDPTKIKHTWTQSVPDRTLMLIERMSLDKSAPIIDVGGGDSVLVDHLLDLGYRDITILDISEKAIERSKKRIGDRADQVNWVVSNVLEYIPDKTFTCWIDRATFHFLQTADEIKTYAAIIDRATTVNSKLIISTFSEIGPAQCSGLPVKRYDKFALTEVFAPHFDRISVVREDHVTPAGTLQQFIYVSFMKRTYNGKPSHSLDPEELFLSDLSTADPDAPSCGINNSGCCC